MLVLCLNTSGHLNTLALVKNGQLLEEKNWESDRNETETLLPNLEQLMQNQKIVFDDLNALNVIQGIGGFTSLRVGISIANTIAYAQKIPIYGSCVFELWQSRVKNKENVAILIDAGRQECFYGKINEGKLKIKNSQVDLKIIANSDLGKIKEKFWLGEINEDQKKVLPETILELKDLKSTGEAFAEINLTEKKSKQIIEPWYGREPNISQAKKIFN